MAMSQGIFSAESDGPSHAELIDLLLQESEPPLRNYILPGLESTMLGRNAGTTVRMFTMTREQRVHITPHSHRFDFACLVLRGWARNTLWVPVSDPKTTKHADMYTVSRLVYADAPGKYTSVNRIEDSWWVPSTKTYRANESYSMQHDDIHSIEFSRDAVVLLFEGPQLANHSLILQPYVNGETVPTFEVKPWMFQKGVP